MSTNVDAVESSSDAVVSSEPPSNTDKAVSNGVTVVVGADSLDSKTETLATEPASDSVVVQDLDADARVSGGEIETVTDNIEKQLNESSLDAVVSTAPTAASNEVKIGDKLLESKSETSKPETSDHNEDGNTVVAEESIDDASVSRNVTGLEVENSELVLDKSVSDSVVSSVPLKTLTTNPSADQNSDRDIAVQDSIDCSKVSGDEKEIVTEDIEKVSDENDLHNEEKDGEYKVTDIIWAKVKNYPWWPAQIFDPSSSTEIAKKHSNKTAYFVGYFGDQTFAYNKSSNIKPFRKHFSKLEKQSTSKPFLHAVNCALDEVSRRVDYGMVCACLSQEVRDKIKSQVFENAGIKKECSKIDGGDRFSTVSTFKPVKVVQSVQDLGRGHFDGFSRLEVLSVRTQLLAFFRWKGYYQLQRHDLLDRVDDNLVDEWDTPIMEEKSNEVVEDEKVLTKKRKPEVSDTDDDDDDDSIPLKKVKSLLNATPKGSKKEAVKDEKPSSGKKVSSKKKKLDVCDSDHSVPRKKEPKGKKGKKKIGKKESIEENDDSDEKQVSVGKKVSSKMKKLDDCDSDDSVPRKKESKGKKGKKKIGKKESVEENDDSDENRASEGKKVSSKKRKPDVSDSDDSVPIKKERSLTSLTPKGKKRSKKCISKKETVEENGNSGDKKALNSSPKKMFRVGDSICRIAKQISESPSVVKEG